MTISSYGNSFQKTENKLDGLLKFDVKNLQSDTIYFFNSCDQTDRFMKIYRKDDVKFEYAYYFYTRENGENSIHDINKYFPHFKPIMKTFEKGQETFVVRNRSKENGYWGFIFSNNETKYIADDLKYLTYYSFNDSFEKYVILPKEGHKIWLDTLMTRELQIKEPNVQDYLVLKAINDWLYIEIVPIEYYLSDEVVEDENYPKGWFKWKNGEKLNIEFYEYIY
jgi:hypothetical protein